MKIRVCGLLKMFYQKMFKSFLKLKLKINRGPITVDSGWIRLAIDCIDDIQTLNYILNAKNWHSSDEIALKPLINRGDIAIDVGANIGFVSIELAGLVGEFGKVIAIEPSKNTYRKLVRTISLNDAVQITPIRVACSNTVGREKLYSIGLSSGLKSLKTRDEGSDRKPAEDVATQPLDKIFFEMGMSRVDFIKIDVEGSELEVLLGAQQILHKYHPKIWIEFNPDYMDSSIECWNFLSAIGYRLDISMKELEALSQVKNVSAIYGN